MLSHRFSSSYTVARCWHVKLLDLGFLDSHPHREICTGLLTSRWSFAFQTVHVTYFFSECLKSFQFKTTEEEVRCVVNQTEAIVYTYSSVIMFRSAGTLCFFTLINHETGMQLTNCSQVQTYRNRFTCEVSDLKPGTGYHFGIISQSDGEHFNFSLYTGKSGCV